MKISVLTVTYNAGKYLEKSIVSVLTQNYSSWEHIIVDGGSTDNTIDILRKYDHLQWTSEPDQGQSDAMNKAFSKCKGDIIVYLNADDWFEPNVFLEVVNLFKYDTAIDMVVGRLTVYFSTGKKEVRSFSDQYFDILTYWRTLFPSNPVCYFYKRRVQERIGVFPIDNHYTMDYWFLLRAYRFAKVSLLDQTLGTFFLDGQNKTTNSPIRLNLHKTWLKHLVSQDPKMLIPLYWKYISFFGIRQCIEFRVLSDYINKFSRVRYKFKH